MSAKKAGDSAPKAGDSAFDLTSFLNTLINEKVALELVNKGDIKTSTFESLDEEIKQLLVKIAIYHCLNGPVGLRKVTTYGSLGNHSVHGVCSEITKSQWSDLLERVKKVLPLGIDCKMYRQFNEYYPTNRFVPKSSSEVISKDTNK